MFECMIEIPFISFLL